MRAERGFTLIEILVVVIIISIILGFVLLAFGDFGASRRAVVTAEQLSAYIKLVQQRAMIEASVLGIDINREGYATYRFIHESWQQISAKSIFHWRSFPSNIVVSLSGHIKNHAKNPEIVINASGAMTEFKIKFGTVKKSDIAILVGKQDGQLSIQLPKSS